MTATTLNGGRRCRRAGVRRVAPRVRAQAFRNESENVQNSMGFDRKKKSSAMTTVQSAPARLSKLTWSDGIVRCVEGHASRTVDGTLRQ